MEFTEGNVNRVTSCSRELVDRIYEYSQFSGVHKNRMYLIFSGMLFYYGFDVANDIYNAFFNTNFIYTDDSISSIDNYSDLPIFYVNQLLDDIISPFQKPSFLKNIYISNNSDIDSVKTLQFLTDKINLVINSQNKELVFRNLEPTLRRGFCTINLLDYTLFASAFDSAINRIQTDEIVNGIIKFTKYDVKDQAISSALKNLEYACKRLKYIDDNNIPNQKLGGWGSIINKWNSELIKPLYDDSRFKKVIVASRLNGNTNELIKNINQYTDSNGYHELMDNLDALLAIGDDLDRLEDREMYEEKVKTLVNKCINK